MLRFSATSVQCRRQPGVVFDILSGGTAQTEIEISLAELHIDVGLDSSQVTQPLPP